MRKTRPECRTCLHRWTHLCTGCLRDRYNAHDGGAGVINSEREDRWEQEEHKRSDGLFVCDSCGHPSARHDQCDRCGWAFPFEWQQLPIAEVPPLGLLEVDH